MQGSWSSRILHFPNPHAWLWIQFFSTGCQIMCEKKGTNPDTSTSSISLVGFLCSSLAPDLLKDDWHWGVLMLSLISYYNDIASIFVTRDWNLEHSLCHFHREHSLCHFHREHSLCHFHRITCNFQLHFLHQLNSCQQSVGIIWWRNLEPFRWKLLTICWDVFVGHLWFNIESRQKKHGAWFRASAREKVHHTLSYYTSVDKLTSIIIDSL